MQYLEDDKYFGGIFFIFLFKEQKNFQNCFKTKINATLNNLDCLIHGIALDVSNYINYDNILFNMNNQNALKNDSAITRFDDDKLDRQKFALQMREIIKNYKNKECLTIGIMGYWGTGKTSLINMALDQNKENILTKKEFKVMRFNPWNFTKQQDLYYQFFEQLKEIIVSNENDEGKKKHAKNIINKYWEKIRYNNTISLGYKGFVSYSKTLGDKTLETSKKELTNLLKFKKYKLIIVIDDVDRLTDEEVQQIFILVKTLADFPNIIYIIPFDREIITPILDKLQKGYGEEFLDKIIQLQIDIPKISKSKVRNIFKKEVGNIIENEEIKFISKDRSLWPSLSFLTTPRDVNRYINNLIFYLPLMKNEVNPLDHILIIGFQLFENKIYNEIKNNKTFFTRDLIRKPNHDELSFYQERYEKILNNNEKLSEEQLKEILRGLFPQLNNLELNWDLTNQVPEWNSELRICSSKMFDKYFELTISESEMSNSYFEMIIKSEDYEFIKNEVLKNDADGKSEDFLEKLRHNTNKINPKNIKLFFRLLYDIGDKLNVDTESFLFSKNTLLLQNIGSLSRQVDDSQLYDAMYYGIKNAKDCLYLLVDDLAIHDQINQRYRFKNHETTSEKRLTNDQLDALEKEACIKIKEWTDNWRIFDVYNPLGVIYEWYFWDKMEFGAFIEKTIQDDDKIVDLTSIFIKKIDENNNGSHYEFDFDIMGEICPIEEIYTKIKSIIPKLMENSDEKFVCESFIQEYDIYKNDSEDDEDIQ